MTVIASTNSRNWPAGENSAEANIDDAHARIVVTATRENWPDTGGNVIEIETFISFDAGQSWAPYWKCTAAGGTHVRYDGTTATTTTLHHKLPAGTGRRVRAVFRRLTGLRTGLTVEAF